MKKRKTDSSSGSSYNPPHRVTEAEYNSGVIFTNNKLGNASESRSVGKSGRKEVIVVLYVDGMDSTNNEKEAFAKYVAYGGTRNAFFLRFDKYNTILNILNKSILKQFSNKPDDFPWREVSEKCFVTYCDFLKTHNPTTYEIAKSDFMP